VLNSVSHVKGRIQDEDVRELGLKKIFGSQRDKARGEWRRLRNEELRNLFCSPNIIRVMISRCMGWARYVVRYVKNRHAYNGFCGKA
jgi:hypothetical protein